MNRLTSSRHLELMTRKNKSKDDTLHTSQERGRGRGGDKKVGYKAERKRSKRNKMQKKRKKF